MSVPQTVIFDLGGTLLDWPDWNEDVSRRWALSYDYLATKMPGYNWLDRDAYVRAMLEAEQAHWQRVAAEQWSGPPSSLLSDGFRRLGLHVHEAEILVALDGYARAVDGWAVVFHLLDEVAYTSDLPHSKPHPSVFLDVARRLDVEPTACVMVGDRMIDDISGALGAGMRAIWKSNDYSWPKPEHIVPTATITQLLELPELLRSWGGR